MPCALHVCPLWRSLGLGLGGRGQPRKAERLWRVLPPLPPLPPFTRIDKEWRSRQGQGLRKSWVSHGQSVAGVVPGTPVAQNVDEAKSLKYTASGAKNLAQKTFHAWTNNSNGYTFSHLLTPSHTFSHLLTPSHTFSHLLTPSHGHDSYLIAGSCAKDSAAGGSTGVGPGVGLKAKANVEQVGCL